jgi:ABC-type transport system involved in cytochrome bd biosynthesis fused ATPase/permease subunit
MYMASTIIFIVVVLGVLLVVAWFDKIDRHMERMFSHKATLHGMDLRDILLAILGIVFTGLGGAVFVLKDLAISLSFALVATVIIVFIMNLRRKSEYRQQWLNAQFMSELGAQIKSMVKDALKEDREVNIVSMKEAFKQALKEDREEQLDDKSKRGS